MTLTLRHLGTALLVTALAVPIALAEEESLTPTISDVMNLVYCVVGLADCEGLQPTHTVDITVDNADSYEAGYEAACADADVLSCAAPETEAEGEPWVASISDVMDLVYCVVGLGDCEGLQPAGEVDLTTDNDESYAIGYLTGCEAAGSDLDCDGLCGGGDDSCEGGATCAGADDAAMDDACAAVETLAGTGAGPGIAGEVVVCPGEDWWLPDAAQWSDDGRINVGFGLPCTEPDGCVSNEGYKHQLTRGQVQLSLWNNLEHAIDDYDPETHFPVDYNGDGEFGEGDFAWAISHIQALYNQNEKACWRTCRLEKEAEYDAMVADGESPVPASSHWYWYNPCVDADATGPWEAVLGSAAAHICEVESYERKHIYFPVWAGITGGHSPPTLSDPPHNVPSLLDAFSEFCTEEADWDCAGSEDVPNLLYTPGGDSGAYFNTSCSVEVSMSCAAIDTMMDEWDRDDTAFAFWDATWQAQWGEFLKRLRYILDIYDPHGLTRHVHINGEGGRWTNYPVLGFATFAELDQVTDDLWEYAKPASSGFEEGTFVYNMSWGGRAHRRGAELAAEEGFGLATHSSGALIPFQMVQHFPHVTYDENLRAYRVVDDNPFSILHSDLELFKTANTAGEYRLFRMYVLGSISVGASSLMVTSWSIPSRGYAQIGDCGFDPATYEADWLAYQEDNDCLENPGGCDRECMFHWADAEAQGAHDFLEWMNHAIGRPAAGAPEAYVAFFDRGGDWDEGGPFADQVAEKYDGCEDYTGYSDNWCQVDETDLGVVPDSAWSDNTLRSPRLTHFGHHAHLNLNIAGGDGERVLEMTDDHLGPVFINGTGNNMSNWTFANAHPHEARSTYSDAHPTGGALYVDLVEDFVSTGLSELPDATVSGYAVKVVFRAIDPETSDPSGQWRLEYHGEGGWTEGPAVCFDPTDSDLYTATFRLDDALFDQGGDSTYLSANGLMGVAGGAVSDLAIRHVSGAHAAFLAVRVVKLVSDD